MKINTLFISDLHLGNPNSNANKLLDVFHKYEFNNLFILGDFIDMTYMKRNFYWNKDHSTIIQKILRMSRKGVNVTYIIGNHDYFIRSIIDENTHMINIGDITILDNTIYHTINGEKVYITHGDEFDGFIRIHPFLYFLGDKSYELSMRINKLYNWFRNLFGLKYWSLSTYLKHKVKNVIKFLTEYEKMAIIKMEQMNCDSIMMGHTHNPQITQGKYYNTGNMMEDCSYIIEHINGNIELIIEK